MIEKILIEKKIKINFLNIRLLINLKELFIKNFIFFYYRLIENIF